MRRFALHFSLAVSAVLMVGWTLHGAPAKAWPAANFPQNPEAEPAEKVRVYVTNFELDTLPIPAAQKSQAAAANSSEPPPDPAKLAGQLVDWMATKLVGALRKDGYPAQRLRPGDGRPESGVEIRGIFTEVDDQNHWRRAVIRTGSDKGKMEAMVAVANLARPDQALYEIAPLPGNENKPGAVITLSSYVPLQKYELDKSAGEDVFSRVASQVVSDLTALLKRNPGALQE